MNSRLDAVMERPATSRHSAKRMTKPVNFDCHARPDAKSVRLVGDFNNWDMTSLPMQRQPDGCWFERVRRMQSAAFVKRRYSIRNFGQRLICDEGGNGNIQGIEL